MLKKCDFLVIGSGLAGLAYALKVADHGQVIIISKTEISSTNTAMAQGGIAAVMSPDDSFENHVRDTLVASLKKLQTDYVDLFLIHFPINHETPLPAIWKQFEEIQKDGLAKSIGVSNFRVKDFEEILPSAQVIPAVNQVRRSRHQSFRPR